MSRAHEVADAIIGTCGTLSDHAAEDEMNDIRFTSELDDIAFECESCGWWCEVGDMADSEESEQVCCDCARDA